MADAASDIAKPGHFILRAELRSTENKPVVCYAFDLAVDSVFVVTDWPRPLGSTLGLCLSFPGVLAPVELDAHVVDIKSPGGPGELGGMRLAFEAGDAARAQLTALLDRLAQPLERTSDHQCRVLLVEDNWLIRDMFVFGISKFFARPDMVSIAHADDVESAWLLLEQSRFDLVVVDHYLPTETGASLIARLRRDERLARLPVVAISVGGRDAREAAISAGADLFIDKPLVLRDLFNTVRVLLQRTEPDAGPERHARRKILVFDDSPFVLAVTRAGLEAVGFEVAIAENLTAFEHQRTTFAPDLLLVDVQMPEAFGDDVAAMLREWHGVRVPILLVSSLDEEELARRAREAQAGYVSKAAGMKELVRRCQELLGSVP